MSGLKSGMFVVDAPKRKFHFLSWHYVFSSEGIFVGSDFVALGMRSVCFAIRPDFKDTSLLHMRNRHELDAKDVNIFDLY